MQNLTFKALIHVFYQFQDLSRNTIFKTSQITRRFNESEAFSKLINAKYNVFCHSLLCSKTVLKYVSSQHSCVVPESLLVLFEVSVQLNFLFYSK
jgi:hypothetical protein